MPDISFIDGVLTFEPFACVCGKHHERPVRRIAIRPGAVEELAQTLDALGLGRAVVLVCDDNTYEVAGEAVEAQLTSSGREVSLCRFPTRDWVRPDEAAVGSLMMAMERTTELMVVAGSGCLTDLTRFVASRTGIPFVSVATAPSMDGYASPGSPMTHGGYKRTIDGVPPEAIIADTEIMRTAPPDMTAAGFGDTIGKLTSRVDWKLSNLITGEYYCPVIVDLVNRGAERCMKEAEGIGRGEPTAVGGLSEALIISGIAMALAGISTPASGSEHNLAHYWEMKAQVRGSREHFHGTKVGVATAVIALFAQRFLSRDPAGVDLDDIRSRKRSLPEIEAALRSALGRAAEPTIASVTVPYYLDWEAQQFQIDALQRSWPEIAALGELVPEPQAVIDAVRAAGGPALPGEVDVSPELLRETLLLAKEIRGKYTLLRAAETLGWLEEIVEEVVADVEKLE